MICWCTALVGGLRTYRRSDCNHSFNQPDTLGPAAASRGAHGASSSTAGCAAASGAGRLAAAR